MIDSLMDNERHPSLPGDAPDYLWISSYLERKMTMNSTLLFALLLIFTTSAIAVAGEHDHMRGHDDMAGMKHDDHGKSDNEHSGHGAMSGDSTAFLVTSEIDGYAVTFHVMNATAMPGAEKMGRHGAHHLMVKVERDGKVVSGLVANSKVVYPNGKEESKPLMAMGDWLMAAYDLGRVEKHQLMLLFKTTDGKKHFGGVHYPQ